MLIRRAEITDIPDILRLLVQVCNVHQAIRPDIFRRDGVKYTEADLRELLPDDSRPVWCALEGERFLGYCFCQWEDFRDSCISTTCAWTKPPEDRAWLLPCFTMCAAGPWPKVPIRSP